MNRVALRGIRSHFVRFLLAVLAVALGVAFIAGTFSLRTLLSQTFDGIVEGSADAQAYLRGADRVPGFSAIGGELDDVPAPIPLTLADTVANAPGVERTVPTITGPLILVGSDGTAVTTAGAPVMGLAVFPDDPVLDLVSGALPTQADQIVLETAALSQSGLSVGDSTRIVVGDDIREVTVSGELAFGSAAAGAILVGLDPETATADFAPDGLVPEIGVYATPGTSEEALQEALTAHLAAAHATDAGDGTDTAQHNVEVVTGENARAEIQESIDTMLGFIQVFLLVFAAVSLFVGGFLITNTFAMSVRERMREFALLRALGASPAQVFTSILTLALVIGVLGSIAGIAVGIGLAAAIGALLGSVGMELSGSVALSTETVIVSLLVGVVMSVVAAAVPGRRAARTAPVAAMRGDFPGERKLLVRTLIAVPLTLLGAGGVTFAALSAGSDAGAILGLGAVVLVTGTLILAPALARHVVSILAVPFVVAGKPLGALARGNVVRNPRRTASTAGALTIGMILVSAASVVAASASSSVESVVRSELASDFLVQSADALPERIADDVAHLTSAGEVQRADLGLAYLTGAETAQMIVGVEPQFFDTALEADLTAGSTDSLAAGEAVIQKSYADAAGVDVGDEVTVSTVTPRDAAGADGAGGAEGAGGADGADGAGAHDSTVRVGAIVEFRAMDAPIYLPMSTFHQAVPDSSLGALFVSAAPGIQHEELRAELAEVVEPFLVISVTDADDLSDQLSEQVNSMLSVVYALLGLSIVIAVLGIVNTLALSVIERTREIALLRAVGLGRLQLATVVGMESVLTAVFGTILGVAVGLGISSALPSVLADVGFTDLVIPWGQLGAMILLAALVGLTASLWPAIRAARLPVLAGLTAE